jgi:hypothetical protein
MSLSLSLSLCAWLRRHQKTSRRRRSRIRLAEGRRGLAERGAGATWCSRMQPRVSGVCLPLAGVKFAQSDAAADGREAERAPGAGWAWRGTGQGSRAEQSRAEQSRAEQSTASTASTAPHSTAQHQVPPGAAGCEDQTRSAGLPACQRVRVCPTVRSCWLLVRAGLGRCGSHQ